MAVKKTTAAKTTAAKKPAAAKTTAAKKTTTAAKTAAAAIKLTAAEKELLELYRKSDADKKKAVMSFLKGEATSTQDIIGSVIGSAIQMLTGNN